MNINYLIRKYGESGTLNGSPVSVYVDEERLSYYKKETDFRDHTGITLCLALIREAVGVDDKLVIGGISYYVFKSFETRKKGVRVYSEALLFKDDFIHDIDIYNQNMTLRNCNLPVKDDDPYTTRKARINTVSIDKYLNYSYHNDKTPTHIFTLLNEDGLSINNIIKWGTRTFEVLGSEDVDEQGRIINIHVIEVLN